MGQQVVDILHYDLEYENIYKLEHHHIKGQSISGGFKRSTSFGIKTTKSVKKIGCANLKTLIENDKLIINDFDTIAELNTFVRVRDSYEAEEGNNDDLVMAFSIGLWVRDTALRLRQEGIDLTKSAVGGITSNTYNGIYGGGNTMDDNPWKMKIGDDIEDLTQWL